MLTVRPCPGNGHNIPEGSELLGRELELVHKGGGDVRPDPQQLPAHTRDGGKRLA
jgi:hypothetical protein